MNNYFKYRNKHESMLNEGLKSWAIGKVTKASKEVGDVAGEEIRKKMHQAATEAAQAYTPAIKRGAKKLVLGVGGASLAGAGIGSYSGIKLATRKKKIKESDTMLFSFAVGMNSAFSKNRGGIPNCLVQEGVGDSLYKFFNLTKKVKPVKPFPASALGRAMYKDPKAMEQAFRLYGSKSKTIKNAIPTAFGKVKV